SAPGASPMNINSASGLPTPKTVCVRDRARCGHFVQEETREFSSSSSSDLPGASCDPCNRLSTNRTSVSLETRGLRSCESRISFSFVKTREIAGSSTARSSQFCGYRQILSWYDDEHEAGRL